MNQGCNCSVNPQFSLCLLFLGREFSFGSVYFVHQAGNVLCILSYLEKYIFSFSLFSNSSAQCVVRCSPTEALCGAALCRVGCGLYGSFFHSSVLHRYFLVWSSFALDMNREKENNLSIFVKLEPDSVLLDRVERWFDVCWISWRFLIFEKFSRVGAYVVSGFLQHPLT